MPFVITSTAFAEGSTIPVDFTCRGRDVSPDLAWSGVPHGAASLVLIVDDPDAHDFLHWSVIDLAPTTTSLPRAVPTGASVPQQGKNDFGAVGYGGPCPPSGTHHYRFTLYALAGPVDLPGHPDARTLRAALATTTILGKTVLGGIVAA